MSDEISPNLADALEVAADLFPDEVAITQGDRQLTWREFDDLASRLAGYLADIGIEPGGRVGIGLRNSPEYLIAVLATMKLRAIPVNVNYRYQLPELEHILLDSGAGVVLFDDLLALAVAGFVEKHPGVVTPLRGLAGEAAPAAGEVALELALKSEPAARIPRGDDGWLLYTGGTTGAPKAVSRAHSTVLALVSRQAFLLLGRDHPTTGTQWRNALVEEHPQRLTTLIAAPLMHGTGIYNALTALVSGGSAHLLPDASFSGRLLAEEVQARAVTDLSIVGDVFARPFADELERAVNEGTPYSLPALRRIQSTGTVWSAEIKARLLALLDVQLNDIIAATEGGPYAVSVSDRSTPDEQLSAFRLAPGARVLDDEDHDVEPGSGEIGWLAAPAAPMKYANDPAKSADAWREVDGCLYSFAGDLATVEKDGSLSFKGRGGSVINTGGEKVYAAEVEHVLRTHPNVNDVVVVGVPHETWGTCVAAVIERSVGSEVAVDELDDLTTGVLARYKRPRVLAVVDEIERLATGKINLRWARKVLISQQTNETAGSSQAGTKEGE